MIANPMLRMSSEPLNMSQAVHTPKAPPAAAPTMPQMILAFMEKICAAGRNTKSPPENIPVKSPAVNSPVAASKRHTASALAFALMRDAPPF
jgi:hypothetical protein